MAYPDPTADERDHMRRVAGSVVAKYGVASGDPTALKEDLEMAGWIAFYRYFTCPNQWRKVHDAMLDAWCLWRYGVTHRGKKDQRPRDAQMISLEIWTQEYSPSYHLDEQRESRDVLRKLWETIQGTGRLHGLQKALQGLLLADGLPLSPEETRACGYTARRTYYSQKAILRRLVRDIQQGETTAG